MAGIEEIIHALRIEHTNSIKKHGDWSNYTPDEMMAACMSEVRETLLAQHLDDVCGPHGMLVEGLHAANCFVKMLIGLSRREEEGRSRPTTVISNRQA